MAVTDRFISHILEYVADHAKDVINTTRGADAQVVAWGTHPKTAPEMGVRFDFASRGEEEVLLERKPANGVRPPPTSRPAAIDKVKMQVYDRFKTVKTAKFPGAYIVPASETKTIELLKRHGIVVEQLTEAWSGPVESFAVDSATIAPRPFQGHRLALLDGKFVAATAQAQPGDYLVRTAQPLGLLAFHILEPEADDGAVAWGFLNEDLSTLKLYPILKVFAPVAVAATRERLSGR